MRTDEGIVTSSISNFWKVFRIVIVIFFLFLMGDAFFRWDGFKYYARFYEFLPSLALITVLWSILAVCAAFLTWGLFTALEWLAHRFGMKMSIDHLLMILILFILFGALVWKNRQFISSYYEITNRLRIIVLTILIITALILTYILKNKAMRWMHVVHERITPLVWLFVAAIVLSSPLVIYHTWIKQTNETLSQNVERTTVEGKNRPNIILVTFDALTARDMSVYGYHRPTTPYIDTWAKEASLFTRHEAASVITTPTTASLMTGKRLWTHQTFHLKGSKPIKSSEENLPLLLKNNGYSTMAFIANDYASVDVLGIENSFDIAPIHSQFTTSHSLLGSLKNQLDYLFGGKIKLHDWLIQEDFIFYRLLKKISRDKPNFLKPPEKVFRTFLWTLDNSAKPFFAWIHIYPPHSPYLPPKPFNGMFNASRKLLTASTQYHKAEKLGEKYKDTFQDFPPDFKPTMTTLRDRYNEFIRYCDSQFEDFIASLSKSNKLKNTIIIVSSDHGESFEHGSIQHSGLHLYEQVTHIPLIIKEPGQKEGLIIHDLTEQIDIPATILEFADIQIPPWMEGRSLVPLIRGKSLPEQPIFSMTLMRAPSKHQQITKGTFAVWEGDYKLIHYLEYDKTLLFNLRRDPNELINLIDSEPKTSQRMLGIIKDNLYMANKKISRER